MKNAYLIPIVVGVVGIGVGFGSGVWYQQNKLETNGARFGNGYGVGMNSNKNNPGPQGGNMGVPNGVGQGGMQRGGMVSGEVTSKDAESLTVKLPDGSSKIILLSKETTYRLASESSLDKIEVGTKVAVAGNTNSDGTTTAVNVEINPLLRAMTETTPSTSTK